MSANPTPPRPRAQLRPLSGERASSDRLASHAPHPTLADEHDALAVGADISQMVYLYRGIPVLLVPIPRPAAQRRPDDGWSAESWSASVRAGVASTSDRVRALLGQRPESAGNGDGDGMYTLSEAEAEAAGEAAAAEGEVGPELGVEQPSGPEQPSGTDIREPAPAADGFQRHRSSIEVRLVMGGASPVPEPDAPGSAPSSPLPPSPSTSSPSLGLPSRRAAASPDGPARRSWTVGPSAPLSFSASVQYGSAERLSAADSTAGTERRASVGLAGLLRRPRLSGGQHRLRRTSSQLARDWGDTNLQELARAPPPPRAPRPGGGALQAAPCTQRCRFLPQTAPRPLCEGGPPPPRRCPSAVRTW